MSDVSSFSFQSRSAPHLKVSYPYASHDKTDSTLIKLQHGERVTKSERVHRLLQLKLALQLHVPELSVLLTQTMGKPIREAQAEIEKSISAIDYVLSVDPQTVQPQMPGVTWQSVGIVLSIEPWNFPCWQLFRFLPWVVCEGGMVLHKGSERVAPFISQLNQIIESSLGQDLFQGLWLDHTQLHRLIADPRVGGVTLTGSVRAGQAVAQQAGAHFKPCVLELGGSDPFIVGTQGDLARILEQAVKSRLLNNGQSCIAAKRFIIPQTLTSDFINLLIRQLQSLSMGEATNPAHQLTGLIDAQAVNELQQQVEQAVLQGARQVAWEAPAHWPAEQDFWCYPIILQVTGEELFFKSQEFFGPVFQVVSYNSLPEALSLANQSDFGLAASLWGFTSEESQTLVAGLKCGTVSVDQMVKSDPSRPFGGIKHSGWGAEMGLMGFRNFSYPKVVVSNDK